jgi:hypothetical protein
MLKPQHQTSPWSPHTMMDGWKNNTLNIPQVKLNIIKMDKLV